MKKTAIKKIMNIIRSISCFILLSLLIMMVMGCEQESANVDIKPDDRFIVVDINPDVIVHTTGDTMFVDINQDGKHDFKILYAHLSGLRRLYSESVNPDCSLAGVFTTGDVINYKSSLRRWSPTTPLEAIEEVRDNINYYVGVRLTNIDGGYNYGWMQYKLTLDSNEIASTKKFVTVCKHGFCKLIDYEITAGQERIE